MRPAHDKPQAHSYCYRNTHKNAITLEILPKAVTENDITVLTKGSIFMRAYTAREAPPVTAEMPQWADNGYVMSQDFLEHIFGPFTRAENFVTNKVQGTGLGMTITKNIVDLLLKRRNSITDKYPNVFFLKYRSLCQRRKKL